MSKTRPMPLPDALSAKQRRVIAGIAFIDPYLVTLEIRSRHNKQLELWAVRGAVRRLVVRLHRRLHKMFYRIVGLARALLGKLVEALIPQVAAGPVLLLAARSATSIDTSPLVAAAKRKAEQAPSWNLSGGSFNERVNWQGIVAEHRAYMAGLQ